MLILLVIALMSVFFMEAPRLVVAALWRELIVFLMLWSLGSFLAVAQFIGMELPNPTEILQNIFGPK